MGGGLTYCGKGGEDCDSCCTDYCQNAGLSGDNETKGCFNSCKNSCGSNKFVHDLTGLFTALTLIIAVLILAGCGIKFITSDEPESRGQAKKCIAYVIAALILLGIAGAIVGVFYEPSPGVTTTTTVQTTISTTTPTTTPTTTILSSDLQASILSPSDASAFKMGDDMNFDSSASGGTPPYTYKFEIYMVTDVVGNYILNVDSECTHNTLSSDEIEVSVRVINPGDSQATFDVCVNTYCEPITLGAKEQSTVTIDSNWESWALPSLAGSFDVTVKSGGSTLETYGPVNVPLSVDSDGDCSDKFNVKIEPPRLDGALVINKVHTQEEKSFNKNDLPSGNYLVTLNVTDSEGKSGTSEINMKVEPFTVRIDSPREEKFLKGAPVTFSASVDGGRPPYYYRWYSMLNLEGNIIKEEQVNVGDSIDIPEFTLSTLSEGYHIIELKVSAFVGEGTTLYTIYDITSLSIYSEPKYTYIYVPVGSWSNQAEFEGKAKARQDFFIDISPLKDCKDKVMGDTIYLNLTWTNDNCPFNPAALVEDIKECADKYASSNGITYERAIGISGEHLHDSYGYTHMGYKAIYSELSVGLGSANPPIPEKEVLNGPAHELGHTYYLCDEYLYSSWVQMNNDYGCPNRWPEECPVLDYECAGYSQCCGETPTFRDYSGSYTAEGTQCSGTTYSVMGFFGTWSTCGYGVSSYEHLENFLGCYP